jgi:hypothetical protein
VASDDTPPATTSEGPAPVAQATEVPSAPAPLPTASPKPRRTHDPTAAAVDPNGEARLLTLARAELKENPVRALTLAEEHAQRFAKGQLRAEREVIALTALVRLGRLEEATPRWQAFRVTFARSAYLPRLSTLFAPFDDSTEKNTALRPLTP